MKILVFGITGQVGREICRCSWPTDVRLVSMGRSDVDLADFTAVACVIHSSRPDFVINAAAYTAVDKAEEEEALATAINGTAVGVLAEEAKKHKALFIHYSTDYVFPGTGEQPYSESDATGPQHVYGASKQGG